MNLNHRGDAPTNYRLKDGDRVRLLVPARVAGYQHDPVYNPRGSWDSHYMLEGSVGIVVHARTPCVLARGGRTRYFANVDIKHNGTTSRVRVYHHELRRVN